MVLIYLEFPDVIRHPPETDPQILWGLWIRPQDQAHHGVYTHTHTGSS